MSVDKHINKSLLFREGFSRNNRLYTHLITGRSIHFFLQFVEPELFKVHSSYQIESVSMLKGHTKQGAINLSALGRENYINILAKAVNSEKFTDRLLTLDDAVWQPDYLLYSSDNNYEVHIEVLSKAYKYITNFGLDFFLKLTTGFIAIDDIVHNVNFFNFILLEQKFYDIEELVVVLVSEAAKSYLNLCLRSELRQFNSEEELQKYIPLLQLFSRSVLYELYLRSENIRFKLNEADLNPFINSGNVLSYLNSLEEVPLSSEIVACWYPFWDRSLFIFNSPFDRKNSIE